MSARIEPIQGDSKLRVLQLCDRSISTRPKCRSRIHHYQCDPHCAGAGGRGRAPGCNTGSKRAHRPGHQHASMEKRLSRSLSSLLRHRAIQDGVAITSDGWVRVDDALAWVKGPFSVGDVRSVVASNDKQRFSLREGRHGLEIRANQGHSMSLNVEMKRLGVETAPQLAVHGTYWDAWKQIRVSGLSRMARSHIHLARDMPGASGVVSGMRSSCKVLIWVDVHAAIRDGITFYESANGVILTEGIGGLLAPTYFTEVIDRATGRSIGSFGGTADTNAPAAVAAAATAADMGAATASATSATPRMSAEERELRKVRKTLDEIAALRTVLAAGATLQPNQLAKLEREQGLRERLRQANLPCDGPAVLRPAPKSSDGRSEPTAACATTASSATSAVAAGTAATGAAFERRTTNSIHHETVAAGNAA